MEYFNENNKSIISDLFCGVNHIMLKCSKCPSYNHNFSSIFLSYFPFGRNWEI